MKEKKLFNKNRIINLVVFLSCFVAFSIFYFIAPSNAYVGEFISDSSFVDLIEKNSLSLVSFFYTNSFYGKLLSNILVYFNIANFSYSLTFVKVANYIVMLMTYVVGYLLFLDVKADSKSRVLSLIFLLIISTNFVNAYDACSLIDAKIFILVTLIAIYLLKASYKAEKDIAKAVLLSSAIVVQCFAFFIPILFVYVYFIIKNDTKNKTIKLINYIVPSILLAAATGLNYRVFASIGFRNEFDFVLFFSSFVMPINRIVPTDYAEVFNLVCSIIGVVIVVAILINELIHKRFVDTSLLVLLLVLEMASYQRYGYYLSKLFQINAIVLSFFIYRLVNDDKPSFSLTKKLKGKIFDQLKLETINAGSWIKKIAPLLMTFVYLVSGGVAVSLLIDNSEIRENSKDVLGYIKNYDDGYLDDKASYFFDVDKEKYEETIDPYLKGGYMTLPDTSLEKNEETDNLKNVIFHRGARQDDLKQYWLSDNFSFETYCSNRYLRLSLYSIVDSTDLTIYCNNSLIGTYNVVKDSNCVDIDLKQYMGQQVVIRGNFTKTAYGPFEKDGRYAGEITNLCFSNKFGIYDPGTDQSLWCNKDVGFYYAKANTNKMYSFYIPGSTGTNCKLYINDVFVKKYEIKSGMNEIMVNLVSCFGKETDVRFSFETPLSVSVDNKPIYCKYEGEISNRNHGIYPAGNDGLVWCNNDFTFYYDDEKYTGKNRFRTYKFYVPEGTAQNTAHIYVNGVFMKNEVLTGGANEISVDLFRFKNEYLNVRFKMDDYIHSANDNREKTCIFQGEFDGDTFGIYSGNSQEAKWCSKECGFYYRDFTSETKYCRYMFYVPSGSESNPVKVYANDTIIKSTSLYGGNNEIAVDLSPFEGKDVLVSFKFEKSLPANAGDSRLRTCVYQGVKKADLYGIKNENVPSEAWCGKDFGFFYKNYQGDKRYRKYNFYNPLNINNSIKCFVNGVFNKKSLLYPGNNEFAVDLLSYKGMNVEISFELDSGVMSYLSNAEFVCLYEGYSDSDFYGIKSDSPSVSDNWCKKEFALYYRNLETSGKYRKYSFYSPEGSQDNPLTITANGKQIQSTVVKPGQNEVVLDLSAYKGLDVELKFSFANILPMNGSDKRVRTCLYQGFVDTDTYGFYPSSSGESPWCKKEFALNFINLTTTGKYRKFNFYVPTGTPDNPLGVYVNGNLVISSSLKAGQNEVELDLSAYQGMDVEIKFILANSLSQNGADTRERTCVYQGFSDSDVFGINSASQGESPWCKKEFAFHYNSLSVNGKYRIYNLYVPEGTSDNPIRAYANGTLIRSSVLKAGMNQLVLDLSAYQGMETDIKFVLDNALPTNANDKRERTCLYQGFSDSDVYGLYSASAGESQWCKKEFAFFYRSLSIDTRYRRYFFYLPDGANENPYKVYANNTLIKNGVAHDKDNEIALDLSSYVGTDVEIKFVFENETGSALDSRELACIYNGYQDSNNFGFYDSDSSGTTFGKKTFGFSFENIQSNKKFTFYSPDSLPDNPIKAYVNGVLVLDSALHGGMNQIELDLSAYVGMDIGISFEVENRINNGSDTRELTCVYCGVLDVPFQAQENE